MANTSELPYSELDQLQGDLREVMEEIVENIPLDSWVIEQTIRSTISRNSPFYSLESELRGSPRVVKRFLGETGKGRLRIVTPNTMAVGLYPGGRRAEALRYGLFSLPNNVRYNPIAVKTALGGSQTDEVFHGRVDLLRVTGRGYGTISPILGRQYLKNFAVIDFSPPLVEDISLPDTVVAYPLGGTDLLHFCAKGSDFLNAYGKLLSKMNIRTNLGTENSKS